MKAFYKQYCDEPIVPQAVAQLPWGHNIVLIEKIKDLEIRKWYMQKCIENGWSRATLELQIKTNLYERQEIKNKLNNFKTTLPDVQSDLANQVMKDPYIFDFINLKSGYKERDLENKMIEQIKMVLLELGNGFSFIGNQYKITVDNKDYFIDLLFYHLKLRCYIVVELKVTDFEPEYTGKMNFYLAAVDDLLKTDIDNNSIGIILCKKKTKLSVEYSLKNVFSPIGISSFEISKYLPTEEEINLHLEI